MRGSVPSVEKALGSLPVVAAFSARLRVRDVIDGLCPVDDRSKLTHGQVIEALVANRLTSPEPLVRVQDWAGGYASRKSSGSGRSNTIGSARRRPPTPVRT